MRQTTVLLLLLMATFSSVTVGQYDTIALGGAQPPAHVPLKIYGEANLEKSDETTIAPSYGSKTPFTTPSTAVPTILVESTTSSGSLFANVEREPNAGGYGEPRPTTNGSALALPSASAPAAAESQSNSSQLINKTNGAPEITVAPSSYGADETTAAINELLTTVVDSKNSTLPISYDGNESGTVNFERIPTSSSPISSETPASATSYQADLNENETIIPTDLDKQVSSGFTVASSTVLSSTLSEAPKESSFETTTVPSFETFKVPNITNPQTAQLPYAETIEESRKNGPVLVGSPVLVEPPARQAQESIPASVSFAPISAVENATVIIQANAVTRPVTVTIKESPIEPDLGSNYENSANNQTQSSPVSEIPQTLATTVTTITVVDNHVGNNSYDIVAQPAVTSAPQPVERTVNEAEYSNAAIEPNLSKNQLVENTVSSTVVTASASTVVTNASAIASEISTTVSSAGYKNGDISSSTSLLITSTKANGDLFTSTVSANANVDAITVAAGNNNVYGTVANQLPVSGPLTDTLEAKLNNSSLGQVESSTTVITSPITVLVDKFQQELATEPSITTSNVTVANSEATVTNSDSNIATSDNTVVNLALTETTVAADNAISTVNAVSYVEASSKFNGTSEVLSNGEMPQKAWTIIQGVAYDAPTTKSSSPNPITVGYDGSSALKNVAQNSTSSLTPVTVGYERAAWNESTNSQDTSSPASATITLANVETFSSGPNSSIVTMVSVNTVPTIAVDNSSNQSNTVSTNTNLSRTATVELSGYGNNEDTPVVFSPVNVQPIHPSQAVGYDGVPPVTQEKHKDPKTGPDSEKQHDLIDRQNDSKNLISKLPIKRIDSSTKSRSKWQPFKMDCALEADERGEALCAEWARGGLCATHRATMFLFCRRTCLCVGPPNDALTKDSMEENENNAKKRDSENMVIESAADAGAVLSAAVEIMEKSSRPIATVTAEPKSDVIVAELAESGAMTTAKSVTKNSPLSSTITTKNSSLMSTVTTTVFAVTPSIESTVGNGNDNEAALNTIATGTIESTPVSSISAVGILEDSTRTIVAAANTRANVAETTVEPTNRDINAATTVIVVVDKTDLARKMRRRFRRTNRLDRFRARI